MSDPVLLVATLPALSGIPADAFENTFAANPGTANDAALLAMIADFYNHANFTHPICDYLGGAVSRAANAATLRIYDIAAHLDGSPHGSPRSTQQFTINAAAAEPATVENLPTQIACAISMHADLSALAEIGPTVATLPTPDRAVDFGAPATHSGKTKPRARARGRVFLGPLTTLCAETDAGDGRVNVTAAAQADFAGAIVRLADALLAVTGYLAVWSRRDAMLRQVTGGWVDDRFDTVRRRNEAAESRNTWTP
jgi:hypothetical protein